MIRAREIRHTSSEAKAKLLEALYGSEKLVRSGVMGASAVQSTTFHCSERENPTHPRSSSLRLDPLAGFARRRSVPAPAPSTVHSSFPMYIVDTLPGAKTGPL